MKHLIRLILWCGCLSGLVAPAPAEAPRPVRLRDPAGRVVEPLADHGQMATVLFFLTTECPVGNRYAPEIARIVQAYQKRGVVFFGVYATEKATEISRHLREYHLPLTALPDPALQLAKRTGATVTPEACVLSPAGKVLYRGRIDDRASKLGAPLRAQPVVRDLRLALDAVLVGKPVAVKFTKPIGCYIAPATNVE